MRTQERHKAFELLVDNLKRLDESQDEDRTGVYHTICLLENLIEAKVPTQSATAMNGWERGLTPDTL